MSVILLSGGQDSVTSAAMAMAKLPGPHVALSFNYGQQHKSELDYAKTSWHRLHAKHGKTTESHYIVDVSAAMAALKSDLIRQGAEIKEEEGRLPSSFVPGRNLIFLSFALAYAASLGHKEIVTGVCQTDYSGYPDCRDEFIRAFETAGQKAIDHPQFSPVVVVCPLMWKTKAETFAMAQELGVMDIVLQNTMTCYHGNPSVHVWGRGCDNCPACRLRRAGWEQFKSAK